MGDTIRLMNTSKNMKSRKSASWPRHVPTKYLRAGEVGYICASIKQVGDARVGDTITLDSDPTEEMLPGYKKCSPWFTAVSTLRREKNTRV